ncbi:MAG: hypothetical protein VKJ24_04910 [Synechococcales bacterium]|nr:hypothetical protein [Synechococcales bacterium]
MTEEVSCMGSKAYCRNSWVVTISFLLLTSLMGSSCSNATNSDQLSPKSSATPQVEGSAPPTAHADPTSATTSSPQATARNKVMATTDKTTTDKTTTDKTTGAIDPLPYIPNTKLFPKLSRGCDRVDLATWQHPTKAVMIERGVEIRAVQLCDDRTYPVFYVNFKYDPQGQTQDYFLPLYAAMKSANGNYPFAFVSLSDQTIIYVTFGAEGEIQREFERFSETN